MLVKDVSEIKECPDCASLNIVHGRERDQVICKDCGLIFEPMIPLEGKALVEVASVKAVKKKQSKRLKSKKRN